MHQALSEHLIYTSTEKGRTARLGGWKRAGGLHKAEVLLRSQLHLQTIEHSLAHSRLSEIFAIETSPRGVQTETLEQMTILVTLNARHTVPVFILKREMSKLAPSGNLEVYHSPEWFWGKSQRLALGKERCSMS